MRVVLYIIFYLLMVIRTIPLIAYVTIEIVLIVLNVLKNVFLSLDEGFVRLINNICHTKVSQISKRSPKSMDTCVECNDVFEEQEDEDGYIEINLN